MAIANTFTGLIPIFYEQLIRVSREMTGAAKMASRDSKASGAALNQTVRSPIAPVPTEEDFMPAMAIPETGGQVMTYADITLNKSKVVPIPISGEEELSLGDDNRMAVLSLRVGEAIRRILNLVEIDLCAAAYKGASRAYGTAGTTPFASSISDAAQMKKILDDNGAPGGNDPSYRALIIDSAAGVNMRSLSNLTVAAYNGTDATIRNGLLMPIHGFTVQESGQVQYHTKGTMTGGDCTAIEPVGETTIAIDGTNSGTILAGDIMTRGTEGGSSSDANKYVVYSGGTATGASSGNFIINKPGLLLATAVTDEWTIGNSYRANFAFSRNALILATRPPARPEGGDAATDVTILQDPETGLALSFAKYKGYGAARMQVELVWGCACIQPEHMAILLG